MDEQLQEQEIARESRGSTGYGALLRGNPNFRLLWSGQIVSLLGDWFNLIASASLISSLTGSGLAVGGLFVVRMLAPFLISPLAGAWADRFNRKTLLIITDLTRAVTVLGFLLVRNPEQVWLLYALTALQLAISGVFFPTRTSILPDIVNRRELGAANALTSATWSVMLALGAALGGVVAGVWGIYQAFAIDSVTFLVSAWFISRMQYQPPTVASDQKGIGLRSSLSQYAEGLRYLKGESDILATTLLKAAIGLAASGAFQVLQVTIAEQVFPIGEGGGISLGILYTATGIGTGLGPILIRRFTGDDSRKLRKALLLGFGLAAAGLAISAPLNSFVMVAMGTLLRGLGQGVNWVFSTQLLLTLVPERVRGRVFASEFAMVTLANAISSAAGGWLLDNSSLGISGILFWSALLTLVPGVLWGIWLLRGSHAEPLPEPIGDD